MTISFPTLAMKATLGSMPAAQEHWAFEVKWDGYRTIAFVAGGRVRLQSSNALDVTAKYPELETLGDAVAARDAVLDGELVVLDDEGRPRFELLQQHRRQAILYAFDVLSIDGTDTIALPYEQRRGMLAEILGAGTNWAVPAHRVGEGTTLLDATAAHDLEGVMAKRLGSTYRPGTRTRDWVKIKHRRRAEVVIGGYTAGTGARAGTFGSLLVGRWADGRLAFAGGVGTGFTERLLAELTERLRAIATPSCPFSPAPPTRYLRGATWVEPLLGATIEITEFTNEGVARQASFVALHPAGTPERETAANRRAPPP